MFDAMSQLQAEFSAAAGDIAVREATLRIALGEMWDMLRTGIGETVLPSSHPLAHFVADFNVELR
jgi:hypothetical protein